MSVVLGPLARTFDHAYRRFATKEKTCNLLLDEESFDGTTYTPDAWFEHSRQYFDQPEAFYQTFGTPESVNFREGVHPNQGNWKAYAKPARAMLFDSPMDSRFEVNNLVPFRWFTDDAQPSDTLILFVPGWARESQGTEEGMCHQLFQMGIDVGLMTKPYHQARTPDGTKSGEYFISGNALWTVRNFQQLVAEIRLVIQWMRSRYKRIGLFGMSSGGFQSCLASNCEEVDFLFCFMTGCNLWDVTWDGMITTYVRSDLESKGISRDDLRKYWSICDEGVLAHHCKAKTRAHYVTLHDEIVPSPHQFALWKALGENRKVEYHAAHYSGGFVTRSVIADVVKVIKG